MIGKRSSQPALFDVGNVFDLSLLPSSFHGQLARVSDRLFQDADFAVLYSDRMGRPSVPPSQLALLVLLQAHANISSEEAIERSAYDLRWAAVLRRPAGQPLCARSTLDLFRAHLILHDQAITIFRASLEEAKRSGLLSGAALRVAVDTKPMLGRGAVLDTYNLLASGIVQLARSFARGQKCSVEEFLAEQDLSAYLAPSLKGAVEIDWSDPDARNQFLATIVADARRMLALVTEDDPSSKDAASLLEQILLQDVVEPSSPDDPSHPHLVQGVAKGRVPSASDPSQRHGRKSAHNRFTGHKSSIATDIASMIIVATQILSGDDPDDTNLLELVEQAEQNTQMPVEETLGDCAYGAGDTRQLFADADRTLLAKVPRASPTGYFPKSAFRIDLQTNIVTCPGGQTNVRSTPNRGGQMFYFGSQCQDCPLRLQCTNAQNGRTITVHPQEALLQEARTYALTPNGRAHLRKRLVVENRLGRLSQLGISQARYFGHANARFQLMIAAAVANFRRTWNWQMQSEDTDGDNHGLDNTHPDCFDVRNAARSPRMCFRANSNRFFTKQWAAAV